MVDDDSRAVTVDDNVARESLGEHNHFHFGSFAGGKFLVVSVLVFRSGKGLVAHSKGVSLCFKRNTGECNVRTDNLGIAEEFARAALGVVCGRVGRDDYDFAVLAACHCFVDVACRRALGCVLNTACVVFVIVLAVCTVIDTNQLAVLVYHKRNTVTVVVADFFVECSRVHDKRILAYCRQIQVDCNVVVQHKIFLFADRNFAETVRLHFNFACKFRGVSAVGHAEFYSVGTFLVDVETAVVYDSYRFDVYVVGYVKRTFVVACRDTLDDFRFQVKTFLTKLNKQLGVAAYHGCLIDIRRDYFVVVNPQ